MEKFKLINRQDSDMLPKTAGVYAFFEDKKLVYIGKAVNIRNRVKSHKDFFMGKVDKFGYFETGSEIEALILEANLIKKHQPKYNVVWRDDRNYFYVAIEKNSQKVPFIYITHQKKNGVDYVGPFVEGNALKKTLRFLRRAFPYYTTKKHSKLNCTWCHLGLCPGPNPNLDEYKKNIKKLILILKGKRGTVLKSLRKEMKLLSKENKYEDAAKIRDRIYNLQQVMSHTHVINAGMDMSGNFATTKNTATDLLQKIIGIEKINRIECYDVSNIQGKSATGSMIVFIDGKPEKSQYKKFKIFTKDTPDDIAMLKETIVRRLIHKEWNYPDAMLIDGGKAHLNIAIKCKINSGSVFGSSQKHYHYRHVKIMALAKGRQELFIENRNEPIPLKILPQEVQNLILQLDSEAHRFAISYHKKLRKNKLLS